MKLATWNLNKRVGKVRFRLKAANAALALYADVLVFTEFFPQQREERFRATLASHSQEARLHDWWPASPAGYAAVVLEFGDL